LFGVLFLLTNRAVLADDRRCLHKVRVDSDPVGAHVYGEDGSYWGQTSDDEYVVKYFQKEPPCDPDRYTLTLKKRGYKTTKHTYTRHWTYGEPWHHPAEPDPYYTETIVVVLDTEGESSALGGRLISERSSTRAKALSKDISALQCIAAPRGCEGSGGSRLWNSHSESTLAVRLANLRYGRTGHFRTSIHRGDRIGLLVDIPYDLRTSNPCQTSGNS